MQYTKSPELGFGPNMDRKQYVYDYPRPMVTVDAVVFAIREGIVDVLLIRRKHAPYAGTWALPGGFVEMEETLEQAVARELEEETGLSGLPLRQFHAFGNPGRDPRGRSIAVAYWTLADAACVCPQANDDAAEVGWFPMNALPTLAFDHDLILRHARAEFVQVVRGLGMNPVALPPSLLEETLSRVHKAMFGAPPDLQSDLTGISASAGKER